MSRKYTWIHSFVNGFGFNSGVGNQETIYCSEIWALRGPDLKIGPDTFTDEELDAMLPEVFELRRKRTEDYEARRAERGEICFQRITVPRIKGLAVFPDIKTVLSAD